MIWAGCRTHRDVTGPMNFKKLGFFFWKIVLPGCHPDTLIDLANIALASKGFVETICIISES